MSKLLKSKFLLVVAVVAVMFVGVVAVSNTAAADTCSTGTTTLRVGSRGQAVVCLQATLDAGIAADGIFGPKTQARVMAWQSDNGLVADGVFGPKSRAVFVAGGAVSGNFPAGCTSASGFSSTTGASCATGATGPCTGGALFNSVTGASCSSTLPAGCTTTAGFSPTTGVSCSSTTPVVSASGEGSLAVTYDAIPVNNLAVNRGESKDVMAIKLKATGSNMNVSRVWLDINTRIWLSADKVTLLDGSTVVAELPLSASTVTEVTAGSAYQLQFNGLNVVVAKDTTKVLTFKVSRPTLTSANASVTVAATSTVRAVDGAGISATYVLPSARTWNMANVAGATGTLTATLASTSPAAQAVNGLSTTSGVTTDVKLMDFNLKATDGPINITRIQGTMASTGTLAEDVASIELRDGATVIATDASTSVDGTPDFSSLNIDISAGTTKVLSIWVKVNPVLASNVVAGDSISAVVNSITATTGTSFTSASITPTVTGNAQTLYDDGIAVSLVSKTATKTVSPDTATTTDSGSYVINFDVTAVGADMYIDKSSLVDATAGTLGTTAGQGTEFRISKNGTAVDAATTTYAAPSSILTADGSTSGDEATSFKVAEGTTRSFHLTVAFSLGNSAGTDSDGFYRVAIDSINWDTDGTTDATPDKFYTFGLGDYVTPDLTLSDYAL
jgi:peptidoglycan hydrolase-like protein with peptidoglycan-binding domain